jgi:hypothetical protein
LAALCVVSAVANFDAHNRAARTGQPAACLWIGWKIPGFYGHSSRIDVGKEVIAGQNKSFPQNNFVTSD